MSTIGVVLNCISLVLNSFSLIVSSGVFAFIIYRLYYNFYRRRLPATTTQVSSVDSVTFVLIGYTYILTFGLILTWFLFNIRTLAGDFSLVSAVYIGDSLACQVGASSITVFCSALYNSFCLQAFSRFIRVVLYNRRQVLPCNISLSRISGNIVMIILAWLFSILIYIPTYTKLNPNVYLPLEFYCMPSLSSYAADLYIALISYFIPISVLTYIYIRIVQFVRHLPNHSQTSKIKRDARAVKRIFMLCCILITFGIPSCILLLQAIITGEVHPLAYRIQALTFAVVLFITSICLPFVNSFLTVFSPRFVARVEPQATVYPMSTPAVVNTQHSQQLNTM